MCINQRKRQRPDEENASSSLLMPEPKRHKVQSKPHRVVTWGRVTTIPTEISSSIGTICHQQTPSPPTLLDLTAASPFILPDNFSRDGQNYYNDFSGSPMIYVGTQLSASCGSSPKTNRQSSSSQLPIDTSSPFVYVATQSTPPKATISSHHQYQGGKHHQSSQLLDIDSSSPFIYIATQGSIPLSPASKYL